MLKAHKLSDKRPEELSLTSPKRLASNSICFCRPMSSFCNFCITSSIVIVLLKKKEKEKKTRNNGMKTQGNLQAVMKNIKGDNWEKNKKNRNLVTVSL